MSEPRRRWRPLGVVLLCLAVTACIPETDTWLSNPATAKPDPRLVGTFLGVNTSRERHVILTEPVKGKDGKPTAALHLVWAQLKPDNGEKTVVWASYRAWPARLPGGLTLLNLERGAHGPHTAQITPRRFFVLYTVGADGSVTTRMPRNGPWSRAVQSGAVKGHVVKGRYLDQVTITEGRAKLARYIAAHADTLFEPTGQAWRRVR
jgi:hypothetical protein